MPEHMVKPSLLRGELPCAREAYKISFETAWPSISETFLIALMSMADTVMVGGVGPHAIAAVGLATQPRFLALALIFSLNVAVVSICARRRGENNRDGAVRCLKQALLLSAAISIVTAIVASMFSRELLLFAGAQADTIEEAKAYFDIILLGLPINAICMTISSAQRGIGQTRISMYINMTANAVNLVLNYLLIEGKFGFPRMEVRGAAVATVIGMGVGLILAVISISGEDKFLFVFSREGWGFDKQTLSSMFLVASGSFAEQLFMRIGFFSYSIIIARLGTIVFAAHQILMNILSLSFSLGEGFGIAATSLVGRSLGEKRPDLSIVYGKVCQRMSFISCFVMFFIFIFLGKPMVGVFTSDKAILDISGPILIVMGVIVFAQSSQMIFSGCLRGAGDTRYTAAISLATIVILRPFLAWFLAYRLGFGLFGAWAGLFADQYLRLFFTMRRFSSGKWMSIEL